MKKLTSKEKRGLLALYVEALVNQAIDISFVFGVPLSKWNYTQVLNLVKESFQDRGLDIDELKKFE